MSSEEIFNALFTLGQSITWTGGGWAFTSRRLALPNRTPAQPALMQVSHGIGSRQGQGRDYVVRHRVKWYIYHRAGADPAAVPDTVTSTIMDAVYAAFAPDDAAANTMTLGGRVQHCWIDGEVVKIPGDIDGQAMIVVPITVLVP